jgi:hypothetical protein
MAVPYADPNFSGSQKAAYAKQYGGAWSGSTYNPNGVAAPATTTKPVVAKPAAVAPKPVAPVVKPAPGYPGGGSSSSTSGGLPAGTTFNNVTAPGAPATIQNTFRDQSSQLNTDVNNVNLSDADPRAAAARVPERTAAQPGTMQRDPQRGFAGGALGTGV